MPGTAKDFTFSHLMVYSPTLVRQAFLCSFPGKKTLTNEIKKIFFCICNMSSELIQNHQILSFITVILQLKFYHALKSVMFLAFITGYSIKQYMMKH